MRPPADLILIQEPYFGKIGTNPQMAQGNPIFNIHRCPKHRDWQAILPSHSSADNRPNVVCYVPSHRSNWTFQLRSDLVSHNGLMCLEISSSSLPFLVFNVHNDVDNSAVDAMHSLSPMPSRAIFLGDYNLHHPIWSRDGNLNKHGDKADRLVQLMTNNGYGILNNHGEDTFFVHRSRGNRSELYTSTLDLGWASPHLLPFISDFQVVKHLGMGSDHHPLVTRIKYSTNTSIKQSFLFHDDNYDKWASHFEMSIALQPEIPETIKTEEEFNTTVESLQTATLTASQATCLRRINPAKKAKWFDSKVREALRDLRKARKSMTRAPSRHTVLRYHVACQQFHYQIVVAKRSHARHFAASVKPGTDLWCLNSWYKGVRKTTVPTLKDPTAPDPKHPIWVSDSKDKATLLATSWFPNRNTSIDPPPHVYPPSPTRPYSSVTNEEVLDILMEGSNTTAPGISGLNYKVWKWVAWNAPDQLIAIVRAAVTLGIHHHSWKESLVAVIPKNNKKDMALPKSHRPIQLIECLGKLVEKVIARRITYDLS